ncbi:MAG: hypothetical protein JF612_08615, partial [Planctomycetia bacterium]|nr:hypothetical protein [Planctomycetia bacterium]
MRLRARGVSGLHCWILRGPQGSVIRRLHGSATLNGAQFDEAPVKIGDCLRIGLVEVEIVACNQPPAVPQPVFRPAAEPSEESAEMQLKLDEALVQIKRLQAESRQAFQSSIVAAERADQLRDALALANDQLEEMYKELAASEQAIERATTELEECRRQLAASGAADKDNGKSAQNAREQTTTALRQCELLTAELANAKAEISKDRESWNIERAELQRLIAQQAEELEAARGSTIAQTCALTTPLDKRKAEDAVRQELEPKLMAFEQQLAAKQREIDSLQQQLEHESAQGNAATIAFNERPKDDDGVRKEFEAKLAELEKQVSDKQHQLATLQQRLDEESAQGCAMTITLDQRAKEDEGARKRLESKLSDMEQQLALREREIESLRDQLEDESAQGCAMTIALNDQTKDDDASRKELQAKLTELEKQLADK